MENQKPPQSPMSVETELTAPDSKGIKRNAVSNDVIATRHLRIVLESITADKNLSEEDRKRKIANFGVLLAHSSAKTLPLNDKKPVTQTTPTVASEAPAVSSPQAKDDKKQSKDDKKMELIKAAVLANEEKRKKRSISVKASPVNESKEPEATPTVSAPAPAPAPAPAVVSLPQAQPKPEKKMMSTTVSKPEMKMQKASLASSTTSPPPRREKFHRENTKMATSSASVIPLGSISTQQPKKKGWLLRKLKGKKNTDERRGDVDEREYPGRIPEMNIAKARFGPVHDGDLRSESPVCDEGKLYDDTYVPVTEETEEGGLYEDTHFPVTEKAEEGGLYEDTHFPVTEEDIPTADDACIMGAPSHASDDTIGTFERDYINTIVQDQEESNYIGALSEGTFEQDAKALNLNALSEGTFEQDARAMEAEPDASSSFVPRQVPQRTVGEMPNLSETTFEQDAATRDGDYENSEEFRMQGSDLSGSCGSELSETTFERDMRRQAASKANQSVHAQIFETPSLESVTTFEKEARGRMAVAARSRSFPNVEGYAETNSDDAASECSLNDHFRQDINGRPAQPKPDMEWETTAAPHPMPKITELQMQLSPDSKSKKSLGTKFFTKFACHCA